MTTALRAPRISNPASIKQVEFIKSLLDQKQVEPLAYNRLLDKIDEGTLSKTTASETISWLMSQPRKQVQSAPNFDPVTEPGIYEHDGLIYRVQYTRDKARLYAKVMTMTIGEAKRLSATGAVVDWDYEYAPGAFRKINANNRITGERAEELAIIFTRCIVCNRKLKAATSVKAGIGPVCRGKV